MMDASQNFGRNTYSDYNIQQTPPQNTIVDDSMTETEGYETEENTLTQDVTDPATDNEKHIFNPYEMLGNGYAGWINNSGFNLDEKKDRSRLYFHVPSTERLEDNSIYHQRKI